MTNLFLGNLKKSTKNVYSSKNVSSEQKAYAKRKNPTRREQEKNLIENQKLDIKKERTNEW